MSEESNSGYALSRKWFDWCFENPEKISPTHTAIFFFAIEHCNRMGWKSKFGFPTQMVMDAIGIKRHETYIRYFNDLVDWGFFELVQKSQNQHSSNIISIQRALLKNGKALDKAILKHAGKHRDTTPETNRESTCSIDKPLTNKPINHKQEIHDFIFGDDIFMDQVSMNHKGKDFEQAFEECYLHFSQLPNGLHDWEWKQKYSSWLSRVKKPKQTRGVFVQ